MNARLETEGSRNSVRVRVRVGVREFSVVEKRQAASKRNRDAVSAKNRTPARLGKVFPKRLYYNT